MTDLTAARLLCEKMTAGEWEAVLNGDRRGQPQPIYRGLICLIAEGDERISVVTDGRSCTAEQWGANAAGIVLAVSILRALCDEGAVERIARVIDPGAGWSFKYAQGEESLRALNRQRQRETVAKAQAIITSIFDAAGREG